MCKILTLALCCVTNYTLAASQMTSDEIAAFGQAVKPCWSLDKSSPAVSVTVTLAMELKPDGKLKPETIKLISHSEADENAVWLAFDAARRAIFRCQRSGYDLPEEKYPLWKRMDITFDPSEFVQ